MKAGAWTQHATSGGKKTRTTLTLNVHTLTCRAPTAEASQNMASCVLQTTTARSQLNALDETLRLAWGAKPCFTPVALALADGTQQTKRVQMLVGIWRCHNFPTVPATESSRGNDNSDAIHREPSRSLKRSIPRNFLT